MTSISRRTLLSLLSWAAARRPAAATPSRHSHTADFRAHATVHLMSITLLRRSDVGAASLTIEDSPGQLRLIFAAGSRPDRAAGLRRAGYMEERIQLTLPVQIDFFGLISASREQSLAEGRSALASAPDQAGQFTAVRGAIRHRQVSNRLANLSLPYPAHWDNCLEAVEQCRRQLEQQSLPATPVAMDDPVTFLYAIWSAVNARQTEFTRQFFHNGRAYQLRTRTVEDPKRAHELVRAGLLTDPAALRRLDGRIVPEAGKGAAAFHLWFDSGGTHPRLLRFEFQARSFLRLTFEAASPGATATRQ